jgi:hypothetical protein
VAANGAAMAGRSVARERERRRGKERREEEERDARRFKHLSRANRIDTTQPTSTHVSYGIWPVSRVTIVDTTESRQYTSVHIARLLYESRQLD